MQTRRVTSRTEPQGLPWSRAASLFGSGRAALAGLVTWGAARHGWRRVWLPSYNCPEVPAALLRGSSGADPGVGVELRAYPDARLDVEADVDDIPAGAGDAVVIVNQLGVRPRPAIAGLRRRGIVVIEDHSHDPASAWALESTADFAFASLRKTLPIEDGGAVWSPRGLDVPPEPPAPVSPTAGRLAASLAQRGDAASADRLRFRALARASAGTAEPQPQAPMSPVARALLPQMPVLAWRERRRQNLGILSEAVGAGRGVTVLCAPVGAVAFALTLVFDDADARTAARRGLIDHAVVPVVLWPLDPAHDWGAGPADADLSSRILSIHGDQRYEADDIRRLASILRAAIGG